MQAVATSALLTSEKKQQQLAHQAKAYLDGQNALIDGAAEGFPESEVEKLLGGLGQEKTLQVVEERPLQGKCANVLCKQAPRADMRNYEYGDAVKFLSTKEVVKCKDLDQYCSEKCFLFFTRMVIPKRPAADVWELQQGLIDRTNAKESPHSNAQTKPTLSQGLVGQVKEKETVAKPKKKFNTMPDLDDPELLARKVKRNVKFSETVTEYSAGEEDNMTDATSQVSESEEDEDLSMASFLDMSSPPDDKIENSGLNPFILVWDLLSRITTDFTREAIYGNEFKQWRAPTNQVDEVADRRSELLDFLDNGIEACNFFASQEFKEKAHKEVERVVQTFDLTRAIPQFHLDPWALMSCVILGCAAEAGRFPNYDFERNDIVRCFGSSELADLDHQQMEMLKDILRRILPQTQQRSG